MRGQLVSRGKSRRADYVLYHKSNIPIALIEAKDNTHSVGAGMQQGLAYAEVFDMPLRLQLKRRWVSSNTTAPVQSGAVERELARSVPLACRALGALSRLERA